MNELLIGFGITSAGFDPLASAPSQEPTSWASWSRPVPPLCPAGGNPELALRWQFRLLARQLLLPEVTLAAHA
jgi:hypothetical protein